MNQAGRVGKRKAREGSRKPQSGLPDSHSERVKGEALMTQTEEKGARKISDTEQQKPCFDALVEVTVSCLHVSGNPHSVIKFLFASKCACSL